MCKPRQPCIEKYIITYHVALPTMLVVIATPIIGGLQRFAGWVHFNANIPKRTLQVGIGISIGGIFWYPRATLVGRRCSGGMILLTCRCTLSLGTLVLRGLVTGVRHPLLWLLEATYLNAFPCPLSCNLFLRLTGSLTGSSGNPPLLICLLAAPGADTGAIVASEVRTFTMSR